MLKNIKPLICALYTATCLFLVTGLAQADRVNRTIRMATTTSTENSGLLRHLLPRFEQQTDYQVHVIAVGTGKALRMGRDGDVDLILVHARLAEELFVKRGYGMQRYNVMYNDFVLVGPKSDPAGIAKSKDAAEAFSRIARSSSLFISRGDDSGTHKKEMALWKNSGANPPDNRYREAGQGMGKVLQIADELNAYTLTDRGTWLANASKLDLKINYEGDHQLHNPYGIIAVNPKRYQDTNFKGAMNLIEWITSEEGQEMIGKYHIAGKQLFMPAADQKQAVALQQHSVDGHN